MKDRLRERLNRSRSSLSRSDGEPAYAPYYLGCAVQGDRLLPAQRRTHQDVTVGTGSQDVQDAIGSIGIDITGV